MMVDGRKNRKKKKQTNKQKRKKGVCACDHCRHWIGEKKGGKRRRNGVHEQESEKNICIKNGRRHMTAGKM